MNSDENIESKISELVTMLESCQYSDIFTPEIFRDIKTSLAMSKLNTLYLKGSSGSYRLNDHHIIELVEILIKLEIQLTEISLPYNSITDVGIEEISRLLKPSFMNDIKSASSSLQILNLEGNDINGSNLHLLQLASPYDCSLQTINLSFNPLNEEARLLFSQTIAKNKTLTNLFLNNCGFNINGMIALITSFDFNNTLHTLHVDRPLLASSSEDEISEHLGRILSQSLSLLDISFRYFNIQDEGAKILSNSLYTNMSLLEIDLSCNKIGSRGAENLASYLITNKSNSIKVLKLSSNQIGDDGAVAIAQALKENNTLNLLALDNNKFGHKGLDAIVNSLDAASRNAIEKIFLFGNNFSNENGKQFFEFIQFKLPYTNIQLDINVYVVDGIYMIAQK